MSKRVVRSVAFTSRQMKLLEEEANRLGITVADLLRRVVDEFLDRKTSAGND